MSYKPPKTLYELSVKSSVNLIINASINIRANAKYAQEHELEEIAKSFKETFLMSSLPASFFDVLCSERCNFTNTADHRLLLLMLFHPKLTVFRKSDLDYSISQQFWINNLPQLNRLIILDLKLICSDEILQIVCDNCPLLEEINIISRLHIRKSPFNACMLVRNISDVGLGYVAKLKQLRIVAMDPPKNGLYAKERCITEAGLVRLINQLPNLLEIKIELYDLGSTLISSDSIVGPLRLEKINCQFASATGIKKLIQLCPHLKELFFIHVTEYDNNEILNEITYSEVKLKKLHLSFFSYSQSLEQLLILKGQYLTHFFLHEYNANLNMNAIIMLGTHCPNLETLSLVTQCKSLDSPFYFKQTKPLLSSLKNLTIGNDSYNIEQILTILVNCTINLQQLAISYKNKIIMDGILLRLLKSGKLQNLNSLLLNCSLAVSKDVVKQIIDNCKYLRYFTLDFSEELNEITSYIQEHNLDIKLSIRH